MDSKQKFADSIMHTPVLGPRPIAYGRCKRLRCPRQDRGHIVRDPHRQKGCPAWHRPLTIHNGSAGHAPHYCLGSRRSVRHSVMKTAPGISIVQYSGQSSSMPPDQSLPTATGLSTCPVKDACDMEEDQGRATGNPDMLGCLEEAMVLMGNRHIATQQGLYCRTATAALAGDSASAG